jgi:exodeoxyribonuclease-5
MYGYDTQYSRIHGLAGTGKTFILKYLMAYYKYHSNGFELNIAFAAFTGNAAINIISYGCSPASTIHRLIYIPHTIYEEKTREIKNKKGVVVSIENYKLKKVVFELKKPDSLKDLDLIVIDEYSMINDNMIKEILSFNRKVLFIGDVAQLQPIFGGNTFILNDAEVNLTDQKRAEVLSLKTLNNDARNGIALPYTISTKYNKYYGDEVNIYPYNKNELNEIDPKIFTEADVVIVPTNKERKEINNIIRYELGYKRKLPNIGEKLICLENNYDIRGYSPKLKSTISLANGLTVILDKIVFSSDKEGYMICNLSLLDDPDCKFNNVPISFKNFTLKEKKLIKQNNIINLIKAYYNKQSQSSKDATNNTEEAQPAVYYEYAGIEFDYGYCITCHKAQGHGYNKVVVMATYNPFNVNDMSIEEAKNRWLYTAITRSKKEVTIFIPMDFYYKNSKKYGIRRGNFNFKNKFYYDIFFETLGVLPNDCTQNDLQLHDLNEINQGNYELKPWKREIKKKEGM